MALAYLTLLPPGLFTSQVSSCLLRVASIETKAKHLAVLVGILSTLEQWHLVIELEALRELAELAAMGAVGITRPNP